DQVRRQIDLFSRRVLCFDVFDKRVLCRRPPLAHCPVRWLGITTGLARVQNSDCISQGYLEQVTKENGNLLSDWKGFNRSMQFHKNVQKWVTQHPSFIAGEVTRLGVKINADGQ